LLELLIIKYRIYTGWPEKVTHYQESSLNCIKNCQGGDISDQFEYKINVKKTFSVKKSL